MKKLLSIMLSIIMILTSLLSVGYIALADDDEESKLYYGKYYVGDEYFKYVTVNDGIYDDSDEDWGRVHSFELYITGYSSGFSRKLVVPDEVDGVKKSKVYLQDYRRLKTVVLSDGIWYFECFDDQGWGYGDFSDKWERSKREENKIRYLYVGKSFSSLSLTNSKYSYGERMENLEEVHVSEENEDLASVNGIVYSKDLKTLVFVPEKSTANLSKGVTEIGDHAYQYCDMGKGYVSIPKTVKSIGFNAYADTNIKTLDIYKQTTLIDEWAFSDCKKLEVVTINGNSEKVFGRSAFDGCKKLKEVYINSNKIPEFKKNAFIRTKKGVKFYVKNKKLAKKLKTALYMTKVNNAKIYVGDKLICTKK